MTREGGTNEAQLALEVFTRFFMDSFTNIDPLQGASPNRVWLITSSSGDYVLRKCVRNNDREWLLHLEKLTDMLLRYEFPVAPILKSRQCDRTIYHAGYHWQLRPYVKGRFFQLGQDTDMVEAIRIILDLHNIKNLPSGPPNPNIGIEYWLEHPDVCLKETEIELLNCCNKEQVTQLSSKYADILEDSLSLLSFDLYQTLPYVLTHGDFHGTNLIFSQNRIISVLDLDTIEVRPRIYDLAIAAFFLTRKKRGSFAIDPRRTKTFLQTYSAHNNLSLLELQVIIPILQLHFLPTGRYLRLMYTETPELLNWYLDWSLNAAVSVKRLLTSVIKTI
ncbi:MULTISPECIES: phosphotransferase enzyme family protein [unclassified Thermoactinomyces]|uniref:phosphotransferase enzyme family protein n=1 Tax=unclassified Thermoactinomyces TaxID=2634588 RepID=UPI0018DD3305|nr:MULTISPECIES: phosphotransferase [unclassified Thermoactinomyces]MBH8605776.1 phosphotransferase [Thermoactinomyces sp. CICC 10522]MBH8609343.1 phosphotransferase [Thermoactinomyces sp. CICC 10521]